MPTILAKDVVARASTQINDATNVGWSQSELLKWLNDGQREICVYRPDASVKTDAFVLVAGTKQSLPADAIRAIEFVRNMGTNGTTPGNAITKMDREALDTWLPTWHTATANASVQHVIYDGRNPKTFYVYPPQPAVPGYIEAAYSIAPADCTINGVDGGGTDSTISVDDIYANALLNYIIYRALSKDNGTAAPEQAVTSYGAFTQSLGIRTKSDEAYDPKSAASPASPFGNG